jgi:uncharacterized membrane protein YpjA
MINLIKRIIDGIYKNKPLLAIIIFINILGSMFGLYYYWGQLMMTPAYLWIFVPDCPLYTFFMIFALILIIKSKTSDTFYAITATGLAIYGFWTMFTLLYFNEYFFVRGSELMSSALFISHFGMALESVLLVPYLKNVKLISWAITATWFFIHDIVDYFIYFSYRGILARTHPLATLEFLLKKYGIVEPIAKMDGMFYITLGMMIIFLAFIICLSKIWPSEKINTATIEVAKIKKENTG